MSRLTLQEKTKVVKFSNTLSEKARQLKYAKNTKALVKFNTELLEFLEGNNETFKEYLEVLETHAEE